MADPIDEYAAQQLKLVGKMLKYTVKEGLDIENEGDKRKLEVLMADPSDEYATQQLKFDGKKP